MKKIIAILLTICSVLSLSACTTSETALYTTVWGKTDVLETSTYKISVIEGEEVFFEGAPQITGEGTYETTISGNATTGFTLVSNLEFEGTMNFDGKTEDFTQTITSKVTFADVTDALAPTYSEKSYDGTTIVYDAETNSFSSADLSYTSTVKYEDGDAIVTIKDASGNEVAPGVATSSTYSLGSATAYDNEQLYLVARALVKDSVSSLSFNIVNPVTGLTPMALSVSTFDEDTDTTVTMAINGVSQTFDTYTVSSQINSTFESGTTTLLLFAKDDNGMVTTSAGNVIEVDRSRLLSFMHQVPYTSSVFSYELTEFTTNLD